MNKNYDYRGKWTMFSDQLSGGSYKYHDYSFIYVQGDDPQQLFTKITGQNPHDVKCTCCGSNYLVEPHDSLLQATAYDRELKDIDSIEEYLEEDNVLLIFQDGTTDKRENP